MICNRIHPLEKHRERTTWGRFVFWSLGGVASLSMAHQWPGWGGLVWLYPLCLTAAVAWGTERACFYWFWVLGTGLYAIHLHFFWNLFQESAVLLWGILAFWLATYGWLARWILNRWGPQVGPLLLPFLWIALEFFRSEGYALRFAWLNSGFAVASSPFHAALGLWGGYGIGFLSVSCCIGLLFKSVPKEARILYIIGFPLLGVCLHALHGTPHIRATVSVACLQLEETETQELPQVLEQLRSQAPQAELIVLQEYFFDGLPSDALKEWCRRYQRWVIVGGKQDLRNGTWANTAFVVGPQGQIEFQQAKSIPIPFFQDGEPAQNQTVWASPWGKIGIAICYDLSYSHVIDRLIQQGAQALIIPAMDSLEWGREEHQLHALVPPTRATEYGVGLLRVGSSGISQLLDPFGNLVHSAPFPGLGTGFAGELALVEKAHLPPDRLLARIAFAITGLSIGLGWAFQRRHLTRKTQR